MKRKISQTLANIQMAGLALVNAMVFHEVLARGGKAPPLALLAVQKPLKLALLKAWEELLKENYEPVFSLGVGLLRAIPASPNAEAALSALVEEAQRIASSRALLRHDLMGRIYHQLLMADIAKYYATYYTSVTAARLLARFSIFAPNDQWSISWDDPFSIAKFQAADLACGSGTLLSALYDAILSRHITSAVAKETDPQFNKLHQVLLEKVLWGLDVLTYAAHLSAVTLALHNPSSIFTSSNIYALHQGGEDQRLGSIDLLTSRELKGAIRLGGEVAGAPQKKDLAQASAAAPRLDSLDLIVMNPPFTRSVGGNLLFGALPKEERAKLQKRLAQVLKEQGLSGIGQAGLGAVFVPVADKCLKPGGRLALVIPRSLLSGVAWRKIRELIGWNYHLELVVASHQAPNDWNFSENTDLSEVLVVARKSTEGSPWTIFVNLWRKPQNEMEAIVLTDQLVGLHKLLLSGGSAYEFLENANASYEEIKVAGRKIGEAYAVSADLLWEARATWGQLAPFAQSHLNRVAYYMASRGQLPIPGEAITLRLPTIKLGVVKEAVGPDRRQVHSAFSLSGSETPFLAFWDHDSTQVTRLSLHPNRHLNPKPGWGKQAQRLWSRGRGRLMVAERLWLLTNKAVAAHLSHAALSNMWWPVRLLEVSTRDGQRVEGEAHEKLQALWLNSTPGLLGMLALRQDTRGGWIDVKKETLDLVPLLDLGRVKGAQVAALFQLWDTYSQIDLPPLPVQFQEAARGQGWRYEVDRKVSEILLGSPAVLRPIYQMVAREPVICLKPL